MQAVFLVGLSIAAMGLIAAGQWGGRNLDQLAPKLRNDAATARRRRALRRGAVVSQVLGVLTVAMVVFLAFAWQ